MRRAKKRKGYVVGIDEAGRGPLAGPVSVAAIAIREDFYAPLMRDFKKVRDSKQLSENLREEWLVKIKKYKKGIILHSVSLVGNTFIDERGIVKAVSTALSRSLKKLDVPAHKCRVLLDGSLTAPKEFLNQKTIIRGDETERIIAMASIVAKVHRDRHMKRKGKEFPKYGFDVHKGYGTENHIRKIKKHGLSLIHRRSFLKGLKIQKRVV